MEDTFGNETFYGLILSLSAFFLATFLTPIYTHFAYKYKFWKKQKKDTVTGEKLTVVAKLHAGKIARHFPTMAGMIGVVTVFTVTCICNLNREQTWLPLVGFLGGSLVGFIDDVINVFGSGKGAAGLRAPVKFAMITIIGLSLGWWFAVKLGWTSIEVPFLGDCGDGGNDYHFRFCGSGDKQCGKYLGRIRWVGWWISANGVWRLCNYCPISGAMDADRFLFDGGGMVIVIYLV